MSGKRFPASCTPVIARSAVGVPVLPLGAAVRDLGLRPSVFVDVGAVFGAGCDGELTPDEVMEKL